MARILITGAGGFVGQYLIKELQKQGEHEIFASVYKSGSDLSTLLPTDHILTGDLTNESTAVSHLLASAPDQVYHLAALSVVHNSSEQALSVIQSNAAISSYLFAALRTHYPQARVLAVCSANVYGAVADRHLPITESSPLRPLNPYAISKITQEMIALESHLAYGTDVVIVRPFNHTGPGQTHDFVIPKLAHQVAKIEAGLTLPTLDLGSAEAVRDFTDVRDMVKAYILAMTQGESGEIYNIGTGTGHTIREVAEILQRHAQLKFTILEKPELSRPSDVPSLVANPHKFTRLTLWQPTISLERTVSDILEYERKQI